MEYYYTDGFTNYGPFTLEQLRVKNITPETRIWYSGLSGWTAASEIPELAGILVSSPQHLEDREHVAPKAVFTPGRPPKTWLVESILVTLFCCLPFGIAGIINASRVESRYYTGDIQGAEMASREAGRWTKVGFWVGLIILILYMVFLFQTGYQATENGVNIENFTPGI